MADAGNIEASGSSPLTPAIEKLLQLVKKTVGYLEILIPFIIPDNFLSILHQEHTAKLTCT